MNQTIDELVKKITEAANKQEWAMVDRLTTVLHELVKIEVAAIQGKSASYRESRRD